MICMDKKFYREKGVVVEVPQNNYGSNIKEIRFSIENNKLINTELIVFRKSGEYPTVRTKDIFRDYPEFFI